MLNFNDKPKLLLNESNHIYYYIKDNEKVWLNNYQSVSCLINEWYYIKNDYQQEHIPYHWKKEFLYLHSKDNFMVQGTYIHKLIANQSLYGKYEWIKNALPQEIDGKFEYGMFKEDATCSLVGACDLINIENDRVVVYEFKNSFNPQTQRSLIEKGKVQLFLYGFLVFQTFREIHKDTKIKLVLLIFEHFNENVLRFEWEFKLSDIIRETQSLNTLWLKKRNELFQKKLEYRNNFKIEAIEKPLKEYYILKNDFEYLRKKQYEKDLEIRIKQIIDVERENNPDQKYFSALVDENKIVGYLSLNTQQLDKDKYIEKLETAIKESPTAFLTDFEELKKDCLKNVNRKYWKEMK